MKSKSPQLLYTVNKIKRNALPLLKRHGVVRASLFGSHVRGEQTVKRDIDFLVEFKGRKSLIDLVTLEYELKSLLRKGVDVITYNSIPPLLRKRIFAEQVVIL